MDKTTLALRILLAAGALGLIGDLLLRDTVWGLNFAIFVVLCLAAGIWLLKTSPPPPARSALWFALPILVFALLFVWRDAYELKIANMIGLLVAAGALVARTKTGEVWLGSVTDYSFTAAGRLLGAPIFFCILVFDDIKWKERSPLIRSGRAAAVTRGLLLALPLVLVFGGLFASADESFRRLIESPFDLDAEELFSHAVVIGVIAAIVGGMFKHAFIPYEAPPPPPPYPGTPAPITFEPIRIGGIETNIVLGAVNLLFGLFVAVQFNRFFGGDSLVQTTEGLTYADHARHGFFELVAVAAITLVMLLGLHALLDKSEAKHETAFRWLSRLLVGLVFIVVASAFKRMELYIDQYGLTTLRLYTSAFMVWLTLTFVWLLATFLRGRENRFPFGAVVAGFITIFALNVMNPDGTIAEVNIRKGGHAFDVPYFTSLSADAAPALIRALPLMSKDSRQAMQEALRESWGEPMVDWREFNFGRMQAHEAVASLQP
jgi:hypothetical protein